MVPHQQEAARRELLRAYQLHPDPARLEHRADAQDDELPVEGEKLGVRILFIHEQGRQGQHQHMEEQQPQKSPHKEQQALKDRMGEDRRDGQAQSKIEIQHDRLPQKVQDQYTMFYEKGKNGRGRRRPGPPFSQHFYIATPFSGKRSGFHHILLVQ